MPTITYKTEVQALGNQEYEGRTSVSTPASNFAYGASFAQLYASVDHYVARYAVEYEGDRVRLDPDLMSVGIPYSFHVGRDQFLAVKETGGAIDFYGFERKS